MKTILDEQRAMEIIRQSLAQMKTEDFLKTALPLLGAIFLALIIAFAIGLSVGWMWYCYGLVITLIVYGFNLGLWGVLFITALAGMNFLGVL